MRERLPRRAGYSGDATISAVRHRACSPPPTLEGSVGGFWSEILKTDLKL
jgi:hypothetical protein